MAKIICLLLIAISSYAYAASETQCVSDLSDQPGCSIGQSRLSCGSKDYVDGGCSITCSPGPYGELGHPFCKAAHCDSSGSSGLVASQCECR